MNTHASYADWTQYYAEREAIRSKLQETGRVSREDMRSLLQRNPAVVNEMLSHNCLIKRT